MPFPIIILYALVISAFIADQLSSFMDAHWQIAEFSFRDPSDVGITIFWGAVIIWILSCIKRKDPTTKITFLYFGLISMAFLIFEVFDSAHSALAVLFSFQAIEALIWLVCYAICNHNRTLKAWFTPTDHPN